MLECGGAKFCRCGLWLFLLLFFVLFFIVVVDGTALAKRRGRFRVGESPVRGAHVKGHVWGRGSVGRGCF